MGLEPHAELLEHPGRRGIAGFRPAKDPVRRMKGVEVGGDERP
jgi:hypothetical protein